MSEQAYEEEVGDEEEPTCDACLGYICAHTCPPPPPPRHIELAEAVLEDHPVDAGRALSDAIKADQWEYDHIFDWAKEHCPPTAAREAKHRENPHDYPLEGRPPWLVTEGTVWSNYTRPGYRYGRDSHGFWSEYSHAARKAREEAS
jgi:hypothetical protein